MSAAMSRAMPRHIASSAGISVRGVAPPRANASINSATSRCSASSSVARARSSAMTIASPSMAAEASSTAAPSLAPSSNRPSGCWRPSAAPGRRPASRGARPAPAVRARATPRPAGHRPTARVRPPRPLGRRQPRSQRQRLEPGAGHRGPLPGGRVGTDQHRGHGRGQIERRLMEGGNDRRPVGPAPRARRRVSRVVAARKQTRSCLGGRWRMTSHAATFYVC